MNDSRLLRFGLPALLLALLLAGPLTGSADDGPLLRTVRVEVVDRLFVPEDRPGPALRLARKLTVEGEGLTGTSQGPFVHLLLDDGRRVEAPLVLQPDERTLEAWIPEGFSGGARLVVTGSDRRQATRRVSL